MVISQAQEKVVRAILCVTTTSPLSKLEEGETIFVLRSGEVEHLKSVSDSIRPNFDYAKGKYVFPKRDVLKRESLRLDSVLSTLRNWGLNL